MVAVATTGSDERNTVTLLRVTPSMLRASRCAKCPKSGNAVPGMAHAIEVYMSNAANLIAASITTLQHARARLDTCDTLEQRQGVETDIAEAVAALATVYYEHTDCTWPEAVRLARG